MYIYIYIFALANVTVTSMTLMYSKRLVAAHFRISNPKLYHLNTENT